MKCRSCGTNIAANALICYKCGTATSEPKIPAPAPRRRGRNAWIGIGIVAGGLLAAAALAQQAGCLTLL